MKVFPLSVIEREDINPRQGIKSSLPGIKKLFAVVFSLFKISSQSEFVYSQEYQHAGKTKIQLKDNLHSALLTFYEDQIREAGIRPEDFLNLVNATPLFSSQIEALQVTLNLFWKISKIDFSPIKASSSERTGGNRFDKKIAFSTNIDLIDLVLSNAEGQLEIGTKNLLFNYISDQSLPSNAEGKLIKTLTILSEETQFKIRDEAGDLFFQQEGIYIELLNNQTVHNKGSHEIVGPFRILHSVIRENFHYLLKNTSNHTFELKKEQSKNELSEYKNRVSTYLDLVPKKVSLEQQEVIQQEFVFEKAIAQNSAPLETQNTIYYGSPGTGKSHRADKVSIGHPVEKVTFHPDYDYHSFVGGYKPSMRGDKIVYEFVPQIFTKIYIAAWKAPEQKHFLQIEEINRGNCAEIFGDLFQLLDRKEDGSSKYEVTAERELANYLVHQLGAKHEGIKNGKIRLPNNLSIIATMNTSDQSLFPMDSAFKRRWDWEYIPINYHCPNSDFILELNNGKQYKWLDFLKKVNQKIFEITESQDKQIGNWFINAKNTKHLISEKTFINKVVFYLWNDVFKDEEETIFKDVDHQRISYEQFFEPSNSSDLVSNILEEQLGLQVIPKHEETPDDA